ncbi:MAG: PilN domain-containing protein [Desulfatirhabdiaceae bacterium]|nr:PilN domain-containing protein [Desulfatirhabdiaceae bacterium]
MVIKELIGIYLEKDALHYCCAVRTISSWQMAIPGSAMDPSGVLHGSALATLREFLQRLSPKTGRQIFLALPRNRFFVRDIQLPPVPLEDALVSVQSVLPVTSHLPLDDVYHDIYLCRMPDGKVNALVIYALRKEIQPVLEIFREIGHDKSLAGLFPISLGIGAWLSLQKYAMPMGLMIPQESSVSELAVYQQSGCVYSTVWQNALHAGETSARMESACAKFHLSADNVYGFDHSDGCMPLPDPLYNKLPWLASILQYPGVAALAVGLSHQQRILLNGDLPRIKVFRLWKLFVPIVLVLAVILSVWTVKINHFNEKESLLVSAMKEETQQLLQKVRPLEKTRDALKRTKSLSADIEDFIRLRPRLFSCFNEIARLVPEGTWFSRSSFQGAELTLQGQSRDALKVMESLRTSALFDQVKLAGSVSRNPAGTEQFSLNIRLKDVEANP